MMRDRQDSTLSAHYDGECPDSAELSAGERESRLRFFESLSRVLEVPADLDRPDPAFLAAFRARRDAWREQVAAAQGWRWLGLRLAPLAAFALVTALGMVIFASERGASTFSEIEVLALGAGVGDVSVDTAEIEPVLRIALGDL